MLWQSASPIRIRSISPDMICLCKNLMICLIWYNFSCITYKCVGWRWPIILSSECAVSVTIHTHPMRGHWNSEGWGIANINFLAVSKKPNWNLHQGGSLLRRSRVCQGEGWGRWSSKNLLWANYGIWLCYVPVKSKLQHSPPRNPHGHLNFLENFCSNSPLLRPKSCSNAPS